MHGLPSQMRAHVLALLSATTVTLGQSVSLSEALGGCEEQL